MPNGKPAEHEHPHLMRVRQHRRVPGGWPLAGAVIWAMRWTALHQLPHLTLMRTATVAPLASSRPTRMTQQVQCGRMSQQVPCKQMTQQVQRKEAA